MSDVTAKELYDVTATFPNLGSRDAAMMAQAYSTLRLAKAIEALPTLQEIAAAMAAVIKAMPVATMPSVLTLSIPDPISAYTANVNAKKIPNL